MTTVDCRKKSTKVLDVILENVTLISEQLDETQVKYCMEHLREHQLFSGLSEQEMKTICEQMVWM